MKSKAVKRTKAMFSVLLAAVMVALSAMAAVNIVLPNAAAAAAKPTISKTSRSILVGEKYNLDIKGKVAKSTYKWTSSDEKVAAVNSRGIVTAKKQGTANIACKITTPDKTVYKVSCRVTVREPALRFTISNKVSTLNLGQEYDLNRRLAPSYSNDKTTWTTSDASIANPDSLGKFIASKEGKVTITGTTMSGKSDSVTITVIDKEGIVTNQEELDALLGSGASLITIKTDEEVTLEIKSGLYKNQKLVVDAPNASVENYGEFKEIEIKQIQSDSWYERAVGNLLRILNKDTRIVVASYASVSIEVNEKGAVLRIENNGRIEEIVINKEAVLDIYGDSDEEVPIIVHAPNVKIKTSVPLNLVCNAKMELEILPGAEKTKVRAANKDVVPVIKGNVTIKVEIGDEEEDVKGEPVPTTVPAPGPGPGPGPNPTPTPTPTPVPGEYNLGKSLDEVTSVKVKYGVLEIDVDSGILTELKRFLNNDTATVNTWKKTTDTTKTYGPIEVNVKGANGALTKTVEFKSGILNGRIYTVTVNPANNSVTLTGSSQTFTVQKLSEQSIKITPAPAGLEFIIN